MTSYSNEGESAAIPCYQTRANQCPIADYPLPQEHRSLSNNAFNVTYILSISRQRYQHLLMFQRN